MSRLMRTVRVTNVSKMLGKEHLRELFGCCGTITALQLLTGQSVAKIEFEKHEAAKAAVLLTGTELGDKVLQIVPASQALDRAIIEQPGMGRSAVDRAQKMLRELAKPASMPEHTSLEQRKQKEEIARTIYVGNLTSGITESHIRELFETVGRVLFVKINGNPSNTYRYGFVEFADCSTAQAALALNGTHVGHDNIRVGKADNPIFKSASQSGSAAANPVKLMEALKKVELAKQALLRKYSKSADDSDDASKAKERPRRSRRGFTRDRSRSRDRDRRRDRRRRERSRRSRREVRRERPTRRDRRDEDIAKQPTRPAVTRPSEESTKPTKENYYLSSDKSSRSDGANLVWDGFQWHTPGKEPGTDLRVKTNHYASASSTGGRPVAPVPLGSQMAQAAQNAIKSQMARFGMQRA